LAQCSLLGCDFREAGLNDADFLQAAIRESVFDGAHVVGTTFRQAVFGACRGLAQANGLAGASVFDPQSLDLRTIRDVLGSGNPRAAAILGLDERAVTVLGQVVTRLAEPDA